MSRVISYRDVEIDTAPFVAKRGQEPKGVEAYAFRVGEEDYVCLDQYVRCRNVAAKYAAKRGIARITLMPFENESE